MAGVRKRTLQQVNPTYAAYAQSTEFLRQYSEEPTSFHREDVFPHCHVSVKRPSETIISFNHCLQTQQADMSVPA